MFKNNPYISLLRTAWHYAKKEKPKYVLVYSMFICANVILALNPLLFGWYINEIQKKGDDVLYLTCLYGIGYLSLSLGEWLFHGPARVWERELAFNLSRNFLEEKYNQTLHLPVSWHQDNHSGSTINRIRKAYEALKNFFQDGFVFLRAFSKFFFSLGAMIIFSPLYGMIAVIIGILTIWIIFKFDKPFIRTLNEVNEKEHVVSSTLFDSLSNIITVITLRLEKQMEKSLSRKVTEIFVPFRKNAVVNEWKWFVVSMFVGLIYVVITIGYVYQNWQPGQVFLVGGLVTLMGYVNNFTSVFYDIAWQYTEVVRYNTDIQTAHNISRSFQQKHRSDSTEQMPEKWKNIEISHLNFSHGEKYDADNTSQSLHDISIHLEKGKKIAFIGESGSGKSTLLALLRGLFTTENNTEVHIDSKKYKDLSVISERVTLFPQEPEIFENTIEYNITLGLSFNKDEVIKVIKLAYFQDVVDQLPNGLNSNIQEKGVNLSGGQKQRLALARGILAAKDSDLVLLDEPTSSVDPKTESMIYDQIFEEFKDKTIISSLHRLHLLTKFDYIYVLDKGKIIAEGNFNYLKESSKPFQELWKHQKDADKS